MAYRLLARYGLPLTPRKVIILMPILYGLGAILWLPVYYHVTGGVTLFGPTIENFGYAIAMWATGTALGYGFLLLLVEAKIRHPEIWRDQLEAWEEYERR